MHIKHHFIFHGSVPHPIIQAWCSSHVPTPSILQIGKLPAFVKSSSHPSLFFQFFAPLRQHSCHSPAATGAVFSRHCQFLQLLNPLERAGRPCSAARHVLGWAAAEDVSRAQSCSTRGCAQRTAGENMRPHSMGFGKSIPSFHPFSLQTHTALRGLGCCQNNKLYAYFIIISHMYSNIHTFPCFYPTST